MGNNESYASIFDGFLNIREQPSEEEIESASTFKPLLSPESQVPIPPEGKVLVDHAGGVKLTLPNPELITALQESDAGGRIEVFDTSLLNRNVDGQLVTPEGNFHGRFLHAISEPLVTQVMKQYPNKRSMFARGIASSISGGVCERTPSKTQDDDTIVLVRDIRHILQLGNEYGTDNTLLGGIGFDDENNPRVHERVNQYLINGQARLRNRLSPETASKIFPVLLVYDEDKVRYAGGNYNYHLDDPGECILKAYILPRPETI